MQPTPPNPSPSEPNAFEPVIDRLRAQRQNVAGALLVLAVVFLGLTGWLVVKGRQLDSAPSVTKDEKDKKDKAEDPLKPAKLDVTAVQKEKQVDYFIGGVSAFLACLPCAAIGAFLLASPPKLTAAEDKAQIRHVVLLFGALLGAVLILAGGLFFYQWGGSLVKWLDQHELEEARYALIPLLMVVAGGGLIFLAAQPARAEERNTAWVRRFIYGANFGLTILLVLVVLVVANAVVALRVQNKLDTTSSGFFTLNDQTRQLIAGLEQPVHAYAIFQDNADPLVQDTKRLLAICQETNRSKFHVTFLSPALNRDAISKLRSEFPMAEMSGEGVLLVAGEENGPDRKRHAFIRDDELGTVDADGRSMKSFNGESRLLRELLFLAENKQKPKVYFTQSSGELAIGGAGRAGGSRRAATVLKGYLEKNYFAVAELPFGPGKENKVPEDASVVVIADPTSPIPAEGVEAIRKFMSDPRPDGKKGKLIVLAGQQPGDDQKPLKLGIEPLLQTYGVQFSDRFLYNVPDPQRASPRDPHQGAKVTIAVVDPEAVRARNPVALAFTSEVPRLQLLDCREVGSAPPGPGGFQSVKLLSSMPGRATWAPTTYAPRPVDAWRAATARVKAIVESKATQEEKQKLIDALLGDELQYSEGPRPLAVLVSEPGAAPGTTNARVAVFGCGWFVCDDASNLAGQGQSTIWLDLMGATLDWVRDRPTVGAIDAKQYKNYELKPGYDTFRLLWVPVVLAVLIVSGLGAGVWVIRRK
ncbi:MAG TPA: Gldg family protein [Gemmata sp.]